MSLNELINSNHKILSIIGLSKNTGKTEVLNALIRESNKENKILGLTSIGRDGERKDIVTNTHKPEIQVEEGTIITTLDCYFRNSSVQIEVLEVLPWKSALGEYVIGRAKSQGYIQLAGPPSTKQLNLVSKKMLDFGCEKVIIDGALSRKSSANPLISDATILSTGAVVSNQLGKVIKKTIYYVYLLQLPSIKNNLSDSIIRDIENQKTIKIINKSGKIYNLEMKTALNKVEDLIFNLSDEIEYISLPGSLTGNMIKKLYQYGYSDLKYIVNDATKIFISDKLLNEFIELGISIYVKNSINLVALTINPSSPQGYYFDGKLFKDELCKYISDLPVINVLEASI